MTSCGAPPQNTPTEVGGDQTVLAGVVTLTGTSFAGAYVRLLDESGNFVAEVVSSANGQFRFYLVAGRWTLRVLSRAGTSTTTVLIGEADKRKTVEVSLDNSTS